MKCILVIIVAITFIANTAIAEYCVKSDYLKNPEKNIDLVIDTADFWLSARDDVNGGFHTYVDKEGNPTLPSDSWWGTEQCGVKFNYHLKTVFGQARLAYAFSKAFMVTGKKEYLDQAQHALDFLYAKGWDYKNGGWYFTTNAKGDVAPWLPCDEWDTNDWKWTFNQIYPLVGITAISEAMMDARHGSNGFKHKYSKNWNWLVDGLNLLNDKLWDSRSAYLGYFEDADLDWQNPRGKGFTGTMDSITTHALSMYLMTENGVFEKRLLELADIVVHRLVPTIDDPETKFGFIEFYNSEWEPTGRADGFVGHMLKAAWCLARAYLVKPRPEYREAAMAIIQEVMTNGGWDHENGGPFQDFWYDTGEILQGKNFWQVEQGFTAGISNYYISDNHSDKDFFLKIADESLDFYMSNFIDHENGGTYTSTFNDGTPDDKTKGHLWKSGYHASELGYLAYLYGNLYYKKQDVTLYYYLNPRDQAHVVKLTPIAIENRAIRITDIKLDGEPFTRYNSIDRTLNIPPDTGGVFKVTFSPCGQ